MHLLNWLGMALSAFAYLAGLRKWVYQGNLVTGLLSVLVFFPLLIATTVAYPAYYLRTLPLVGVGMFLHHYGSRILMQIKLLWFTTLSVIVVQFYFLFFGQFVFAR